MNRLVLIGAGGHGKVVADAASLAGYQDIVFFDRDFPERKVHSSWPITNDIVFAVRDTEDYFVSIGNNARRAEHFEMFDKINFTTILHPASVVSSSANIGAGSVAMAGCVVNADAMIGRGAILNTGCSVDHDCQIGNFVHISPGARLAGNVSVGARSWIGIGASVREGITIGKDVIVGAGAAVVVDIPDGQTVIGVPARALGAG